MKKFIIKFLRCIIEFLEKRQGCQCEICKWERENPPVRGPNYD